MLEDIKASLRLLGFSFKQEGVDEQIFFGKNPAGSLRPDRGKNILHLELEKNWKVPTGPGD